MSWSVLKLTSVSMDAGNHLSLFVIIISFIIVLKLNVCIAISDEVEILPEQVIDGRDQDIKLSSKSTCETLPSSIHVTKEEHDQAGNVIRICEGTIIVNKCEGTCVSQLQPSVTKPTGFLKVISFSLSLFII